MLKKIPLYKFYRHKYGPELLIDVLLLDDLKAGIRLAPVHCETFYQIILFTTGGEQVAVNGCRRIVNPGDVVCARPGEVWEWQSETSLEGDVLIFEGSFLLSFFNDSHFLDGFPYLQEERLSPYLYPEPSLQERLRQLFGQMKEEIDAPRSKDQHILRAMLYEFLMLLNRAEGRENDRQVPVDCSVRRYVDRFVRLADQECGQHHDVGYYADRLCITSNYLNRLVSGYLGVTTKQYLKSRLLHESKRLLAYTTLSVGEIADELHFESTAYFIRFFHKAVGMSPAQYRKAAVQTRIH